MQWNDGIYVSFRFPYGIVGQSIWAHDISFGFELYNIISLIYIGPLLKVLKCYISTIIFLLTILFLMIT